MMTQLRQLAAALAVGFVGFAIGALPVTAQQLKQVKLTEKQVLGLLAAQDDFAPLASKLAEAADAPSPELTKQLDTTAQRHGFANFEEYRIVDNNIFLVFEGLDRETGAYVPPQDRLKLELKEIEGDNSIPADDKKAIMDEVKEELKLAEAVQYPENVELVKKHIDKLSKLLPQPEDPSVEAGPDGEPGLDPNRGSGVGNEGVQ